MFMVMLCYVIIVLFVFEPFRLPLTIHNLYLTLDITKQYTISNGRDKKINIEIKIARVKRRKLLYGGTENR